jgi:cytoskeleton protein RodZ
VPEIGATLREARMRAHINISEIESETKIRAKYLRALENEEWGLLPGPAYVRSFLRTYAEALDLDAKMLLEEYKLRHERPSDHDLMPIGAPRRRGRGGLGGRGPQRGGPQRGAPRWLVVGVLVIALLGALWALGHFTGTDDGGDIASTAPRTSTTTTTMLPRRTATVSAATRRRKAAQERRRRKAAADARLARLQIVPTGPGPVYACLQGAGGELRLPGVSLQPGATSGTYRSSEFRLRLGNGNARLRVNGKLRVVADASPVAYVITRKTFKRVDPSQTPSCGR